MFGPDGFELPRLLGDLERRLCERLAGRLSAVGSSLNEWRVLAQLVEGPGKAMSDVAGWLNIPASSATKLVDAMVAANLVYRRGDETDRRKVVIHLAPRGRAAYDQIAPLVHAEQNELATIADEADLRELARLLAQLSERVG